MSAVTFARILAVLVAFGLAACSAPERSAVAPAREAAAAIIPVLDLLRIDANTALGYQISPDGRRLSWIALAGTLPQVHVRLLGEARVDVVATPFAVARYFWGPDSRHVLFQVDDGASENTQIFAGDVARPDAPPLDLTPFPGTRNSLLASPSGTPDGILILSNRRDASLFDLYRLPLDGGPPLLIDKNPGDVITWYPDRRGVPFARLRGEAGDRRAMEFRDAVTGRWHPLLTLDFEDTFRLLDSPGDHAAVWALSNRGRDRISLVRLDSASGAETVVLSDPLADLEGALVDDLTGQPLLAWSAPDYPRLHFLDAALADDFSRFTQAGPSAISVLSTDNAHQHMVVEVFSEAKGSETYLLDRPSHRAIPLAGSPLNRFRDRFPSTRPIAFQSRDGLTLHGYLTLPRGGAARRRLPLVLEVHGGPWSRDDWPLRSFTLMLANRGYAVLRINYRGSLGYGRAFREAAVGQFAGRMQDDLTDGVQWAVAEDIADPDKIAIIGESYGGYAALVGVSFTPHVFAAGVDLFGISDLPSFFSGVPAYWRSEMPLWRKYVGDPERAADLQAMQAKSPLAHAMAIDRPLLVVQGADDVRVRRDQSDRLVEALRAAGKPVTYLLFAQEGHGITRAPDLALYYHELELFLARSLGGAVGPWSPGG